MIAIRYYTQRDPTFCLFGRSPSTVSEDSLQGENYQDHVITLKRGSAGFGFRIIGGKEEGTQVRVSTCIYNELIWTKSVMTGRKKFLPRKNFGNKISSRQGSFPLS